MCFKSSRTKYETPLGVEVCQHLFRLLQHTHQYDFQMQVSCNQSPRTCFGANAFFQKAFFPAIQAVALVRRRIQAESVSIVPDGICPRWHEFLTVFTWHAVLDTFRAIGLSVGQVMSLIYTTGYQKYLSVFLSTKAYRKVWDTHRQHLVAFLLSAWVACNLLLAKVRGVTHSKVERFLSTGYLQSGPLVQVHQCSSICLLAVGV